MTHDSPTNPAESEDATAGHSDNTGAPAPGSPPPLVRYRAMRSMVEAEPMNAAAFADALSEHARFIEYGGAGGRWETLVTTADYDAGIVFAVYLPPQKVEEGEQAELAHKRLEGLALRGVELPYADLCGVACRAQDLAGANLAGALATDADFSGSSFQNANLAGADFSRSEMVGCDFRGADLRGTDFEQCDLSGADLRDALTEGARFPGARLEGVKQ